MGLIVTRFTVSLNAKTSTEQNGQTFGERQISSKGFEADVVFTPQPGGYQAPGKLNFVHAHISSDQIPPADLAVSDVAGWLKGELLAMLQAEE